MHFFRATAADHVDKQMDLCLNKQPHDIIY